jgi:scyllo-inositol 2-dehydrogenase (NADP+)
MVIMEKIKWGILSTGRIAKIFAEGLKYVENAELFAVGSRNIESAKQFATNFNVPKAYGSYQELVKDPDVDVIYVATPHNLHCENTLMALEHNKHVLCEKPLGVNGKEVRRMMSQAKEKNLFLMEALWSRFLPNIIKTKKMIDAGEIGKIKLLTVYFAFRSMNGPEHKQFNRDLCGGSLLDIGIYNVFLTLFLLGSPKGFKAMAGIGKTEVDDTCSITFQYEEDTIAVTYSSYMANTPTVAEIHGETGKIFLEDRYFRPGKVKLTRNNGEEKLLSFDFKGNGYNYEAEEVVKCIQAGKTESDKMSWKKSLELHDMLDSIRKECGIVYPKHDL